MDREYAETLAQQELGRPQRTLLRIKFPIQ